MFVSLAQLCVVYVVKEVASFQGLGQLMGVVHKELALKLQSTDQQEDLGRM